MILVLAYVIPCVLVLRDERHDQPVAVRHGLLFHRRDGRQALPDVSEQLHPQVPVLHLTASEYDREPDLVVRPDELGDVLELDIQVVRPDMRLEAHFLQQSRLLLAASLPDLFLLFVAELRVVQDLADRRSGLRRDLDEIPPPAACQGQGFRESFDA